MKICKIEGCNNKHYAKGYCSKHYTQLRRHGEVLDRTKYDSNEIIIHDTYAEIIIYNQKCEEIAKALIDIDDIEKCKQYKWFFSGHGYIVNSNYIKLHRFITNCPKGKEVDHINHNKLDNRKSNLRICTHQENNCNKGLMKTNTSGVTGVSWDESRGKWIAYIKGENLGRFNTKDEAIKARKEAEIKYFGEYRNREGE